MKALHGQHRGLLVPVVVSILSQISNNALRDSLRNLRRVRHFCVESYVNAKKKILIDYFNTSIIEACVVGLSGGVDSATTLALLHTLMMSPDCVLKKIIPVALPVYSKGSTNQNTAKSRAILVANAFELEAVELDLSAAHQVLQQSADKALGIEGQAWASGQLVSTIRTPALYYITSLLTQEGLRSVVCGTTNRDEGAYLGFFGKASDAMVDIQVISDIHKSEVYQLAKFFNIPDSVINAQPTGDTFDGKTDEEMFGVGYDFVELFLLYLCLTKEIKAQLYYSWTKSARDEFDFGAEKLRMRHQKNIHKYFSGTSAIHFDVYQRAVPGGWQGPFIASNNQKDAIKFVGYFDRHNKLPDYFRIKKNKNIKKKNFDGFNQKILLLEGVFDEQEVDYLLHQYSSASLVPANIHGRSIIKNAPNEVHSYRATSRQPELADLLFFRIAPYLNLICSTDAYVTTDMEDHLVWRACGVNEVFRYINYPKNSMLIPHYDSAYDFGDQYHRTLMSVIIYLTDSHANDGGLTRFLLDKQRYLPKVERDFTDHCRSATSDQALLDVIPKSGSILIFDHRLLHEVTLWLGSTDRVIIRTDIVFEKCGLVKAQELSEQTNLSEKTVSDPFYAAARELQSIKDLEEAGYFDDKFYLKGNFNTKWLITPLHKIQYHLMQSKEHKKTEPLMVLLSTGGFSPIHEGHIELMHLAKQTLEERGFNIIGGYFSLDHDAYVKTKSLGESLSTADRLKHCEQKVLDSDWLMIDSWQLFCHSSALNFTTVIERLSAYLATHIVHSQPIHVAYVCGADNARFSLSFLGRGHCVVVPRIGYEPEYERYRNHKLVVTKKNIFFADQNRIPPNIASKNLRTHINLTTEQQKKTLNLYVRNEQDWAIEPWIDKIGRQALTQRYDHFQQRLIALLNDCYQNDYFISIIPLYLKQQREQVLKDLKGKHIISLDSCIKGTFNIGMSRCFPLSDATKKNNFVARPGYTALEDQIASIPQGEYTLLDDDSVTGRTIKYAINLLSNHCTIKDIYTLINPPKNEHEHDNCYEVCDTRDFLIGAREAGLVVSLPNGVIGRAPYVMPYIRPSARLSMPCSQELFFSYRVMQLNYDFFKEIDALHVADTDCSFRSLMYYLGFDDDTSLLDICAWHLEQFEESKKNF